MFQEAQQSLVDSSRDLMAVADGTKRQRTIQSGPIEKQKGILLEDS